MTGIFLPNANGEFSLGPALDGILAELGAFENYMHFMVAFPHVAWYVYDWGWRQGPWRHDIELLSIRNLVHWHSHVISQDQDKTMQWPLPLNLPLDQQLVADNAADQQRPTEWLVRNDYLDVLMNLYQQGYWNPLGYTSTGRSFLLEAFKESPPPMDVLLWILDFVQHYQLEGYITDSIQIQGLTDTDKPENTLDLLLEYGQYPMFQSLLNVLVQRNARFTLTDASLRTLCRFIDAPTAKVLLNDHKIDVASAAPSPQGETVWHMAVQNENINILEFLYARTPGTINTECAATPSFPTAILHAHHRNKYRYFDKLLRMGASLDADELLEEVLADLPQTNNRFLRRLIPLQRYPAGQWVANGTCLHVILHAADIAAVTLANNTALSLAARRARLCRVRSRAARLIALVRRGNPRGYPDPRTIGDNGISALQYGHIRGWKSEILPALETSGPAAARNRATQDALEAGIALNQPPNQVVDPVWGIAQQNPHPDPVPFARWVVGRYDIR